MSRSLSTPSYSGQPAKRSFPEAMITDCGWRGSLYRLFVRSRVHTIFAQPVYHLFMDGLYIKSLVLLSLEYVGTCFSQELKLAIKIMWTSYGELVIRFLGT